MHVRTLMVENPLFPPRIAEFLGKGWERPLQTLGDPELLRTELLGLVCSVRCPGNIILTTYEFAKTMPQRGQVIIGGFHSPMERQCLELLLARSVPVVVCPARDLRDMRIPLLWKPALGESRMLVLSGFQAKGRRVTQEVAFERNRFVAAVADRILIPFAAPGGSTEALARTVIQWGKQLETFPEEGNNMLIAMGARAISGNQRARQLAGAHDCGHLFSSLQEE